MEYELDSERADKAYETLLSYLSKMRRTKKECVSKLYEKGFHKNEVEFAIEKAERYRFIDDAEYVRCYIRSVKNRMGALKIKHKLTSEKQLDRRLVDSIADELLDEDFEKELCAQMAGQYISKKRPEGKEGAAKLAAHLYQKGFEWSVINFTVKKAFEVYDD